MNPLVLLLLLASATVVRSADIYRDCTRDLYDRVVRFEYLYYEGYWMYPYNKLRQHGPSYHYTEREFCERIENMFLFKPFLVQPSYEE